MRIFHLLLCSFIILVSCEKLVHYADDITFYYVNNSDYIVTISADAPDAINTNYGTSSEYDYEAEC